MSGLLERIVRRRRESASSRLGPPTQNGHPSPFEVPYLNGHENELPVMHVNGDAGTVEVSENVEVPEKEPELVENVATSEAVEFPETEPGDELDEIDEPAPMDDESPTMEHRVLVLNEQEPEPLVADQPNPADADEPESEPTEPDHPMPEPRFRERGRIRRRARYLRRLRELQLRDIGGFTLELHRFGRERPDLLQAKLAGAAQTDAELRALDQALGAEEPLRELREAGIGGVCNHCGAVHGSEDRFCATCGEPLRSKSHVAGRSPELGTFFTQE